MRKPSAFHNNYQESGWGENPFYGKEYIRGRETDPCLKVGKKCQSLNGIDKWAFGELYRCDSLKKFSVSFCSFIPIK